MDPGSDPSATSTIQLVAMAKSGDAEALSRLLDRFLPRLTRWASGRLPRWVRDLSDTDDLVQDTLVRTVRSLNTFEMRGEGAFQAYLRQAILNRVKDEARGRARRPHRDELADDLLFSGASPLEATIGQQTMERYERALRLLEPEAREAVIARVEMGCSYQEIADLIGKPSPDAARMTVSRAILRLAQVMKNEA
ncbi:MAG: RNA polymerase sigma factor [Acidobacteriota bacterium]|nr:RNA polymerase sigma factor [Acidobacteriota bacterium]